MYKKENFIEEVNNLAVNDRNFYKRLFYGQTKTLNLIILLKSRLSRGLSFTCILFSCLFGKYSFFHDNLCYLTSFDIWGFEYNSVVSFIYCFLLVNFVFTLSMVVSIIIELWSWTKYVMVFFLAIVLFFLLYDSWRYESFYYFRAKVIACCIILLFVSYKKIKYCIDNKVFCFPKVNSSYSKEIDKRIFQTLVHETEDSFDELNKKVCNLIDLKRISSFYLCGICVCTVIPLALILLGYIFR